MEFKTYKRTLEKLGAIKSPYYMNNNYFYFLHDLMFTFVDNNDDKKNSNDNNSLRWNTFVWGKEGICQVRGLIPKRVIDELIDYDDFSLKEVWPNENLCVNACKFGNRSAWIPEEEKCILYVEISTIKALIAFIIRMNFYYSEHRGCQVNNSKDAFESITKNVMVDVTFDRLQNVKCYGDIEEVGIREAFAVLKENRHKYFGKTNLLNLLSSFDGSVKKYQTEITKEELGANLDKLLVVDTPGRRPPKYVWPDRNDLCEGVMLDDSMTKVWFDASECYICFGCYTMINDRPVEVKHIYYFGPLNGELRYCEVLHIKEGLDNTMVDIVFNITTGDYRKDGALVSKITNEELEQVNNYLSVMTEAAERTVTNCRKVTSGRHRGLKPATSGRKHVPKND